MWAMKQPRIRIDIDPVAKPRMTQRDRWARRPCVVRYWDYCEALRKECKRQRWLLPDSVAMIFIVPMPKSWTKKRRTDMDGEPHQKKPDADNLAKSVLDALRPENDSEVWLLVTEKLWGDQGAVILGTLDGPSFSGKTTW